MYIRPRIFLTLSFLALASMPQIAFAKLDLYNPNKRYGDEKIAINDSSSRCLTAASQKLYNAAVLQADKDFSAAKNKESASFKAAYKIYEKDISLGWEAMKQPYCGFGAFGASAAQKSLQKTLTRARTNFLAQVKLGTVPVATTATEATATKVAVSAVKTAAAPTPVVKKTSLSLQKLKVTHTLKYGQRSGEVKALQDFLVKEGFLTAENATGYFGINTQKAIVAFQLKHKLIASRAAAGAGLVGPKTRQALNF